MKPDLSRRVNELLELALSLEKEARLAFLEELDKSNPSLAVPVRSLLASLEEAEDRGFLDTGDQPLVISDPHGPDLDRIGPYRTLKILGRGGMGTVYLAEQTEPVKREVALKLVRQVGEPGELLRRFENERQLLAFLDHRHITRVYDFGSTERGDTFFTMEYVPGPPITEFCDKNRFPIRERLKLFVDLCEAVHHAHLKGIIHRDIKPGNVLVKREDGAPVPKIIDFGIARAISDVPGLHHTHTGVRTILGTPAFMSPEQAMGRKDIDTRTDIYSLGALLYMLLVGSTPLGDERNADLPLDERLDLIHRGHVTKPSSRLRPGGEADEEIARSRGCSVASLTGLVRGDLDRITTKAIAWERARRYGSASELAADIRRYLNHEPVLAMPPSTLYRIGRFVRRYRVGVVAACMIFLALVSGFTATALALYRARQAEAQARSLEADAHQSAQRAQTAYSLLQEMLASPDPFEDGRDFRVSELLDRFPGSSYISTTDDETEALLYHTIGRTYAHLGLYERAFARLDEALSIRINRLGPGHPDTLDTSLQLTALLVEQGKFEEAEMLGQSSLESARQHLGDRHPWTLKTLIDLGGLYHEWRRYEEATCLCEEALPISLDLHGEHHGDTVSIYNCLGLMALYRKDPYTATHHLGQAAHLARQIYGEKHLDTMSIEHNYLGLLNQVGRAAEAEPEAERLYLLKTEIFGPAHPRTFTGLALWGGSLAASGANERAEDVFRLLLERGRAFFEEGHPRLAYCLNYLGRATYANGKYAEAVRCFEEALLIEKKAYGPENSVLAVTHFNLGAALDRDRKSSPARTHLERALSLFKEHENPGGMAPTLVALARLHHSMNRPVAAREAIEEAVALTERRPDFPPVRNMIIEVDPKIDLKNLAEALTPEKPPIVKIRR